MIQENLKEINWIRNNNYFKYEQLTSVISTRYNLNHIYVIPQESVNMVWKLSSYKLLFKLYVLLSNIGDKVTMPTGKWDFGPGY